MSYLNIIKGAAAFLQQLRKKIAVYLIWQVLFGQSQLSCAYLSVGLRTVGPKYGYKVFWSTKLNLLSHTAQLSDLFIL